MKTTNKQSMVQRMTALPGRVARERNPVRYLLAKLLVKTGTCRYLTIEREGYRLRFHPSAMSSTLWIGSDDRREDERVLERILKPGDTFVDVGANIGSLTLKAASIVGPQGSVTGIEAHPRTFGFLQHNVAINPFRNVALHNCAVGNKKALLHFANQASDDQNCIVDEGSPGAIPVEVLRLDDFDFGDIALLKIDVEGYEKFVFEGASRTLAYTKVIYFECWDRHCKKYNYAPREILAVLRGLGFELFHADGEEMVQIDDAFECSNCVNIIALKPGPGIP